MRAYQDSWTEEKEARLFRYLEDTPMDAVNCIVLFFTFFLILKRGWSIGDFRCPKRQSNQKIRRLVRVIYTTAHLNDNNRDKKQSLVIGEKDEHTFLKDEDQGKMTTLRFVSTYNFKDEGRVSIFKEEAYHEEIQGEPYQKNHELESVSRRLESLELNQAKENFKQPTSSNELMGNFPPENKPASEGILSFRFKSGSPTFRRCASKRHELAL